MYNLLITLDHRLFLFISQLPHTPFSDAVALTLSGAMISTIAVWLLLSIWLFVREEKRDHWFFLPMGVASGLSLLMTEIVLKNYFARSRPPGAMLTDYSFPSGHATFAWALAVILAAKEPRAKWVFYGLAFLISLSRVYLGVHYPYDIIAGMLVGLVIGYFSLWFEQNMIKYLHVKVKRKRTPHNRSR